MHTPTTLNRDPSRKRKRKRTKGDDEREHDQPRRLSPADRLLNARHNLSADRTLYNGGPLSTDEIELIRRALSTFKEQEALTTDALVSVIQLNTQGNPRSYEQDQSKALWDMVFELPELETRTKRSVRDWIRKNYKSSGKTGSWSAQEDQLLASAYAAHPKQWGLIAATVATRSPADCQFRWRDYTQHSAQKKAFRWADEEVDKLRRAIDKVRDPFTGCIAWAKVSEELQHTRSRIQCLQKWQRLQKHQPRPRRPTSSAEPFSSTAPATSTTSKTSTVPMPSTAPTVFTVPKAPATPMTPPESKPSVAALSPPQSPTMGSWVSEETTEDTKPPPPSLYTEEEEDERRHAQVVLCLWVAMTIFDEKFKVDLGKTEDDVHWRLLDGLITRDETIRKARMTEDARGLRRALVAEIVGGQQQACFADTVIYVFNALCVQNDFEQAACPLPSRDRDMDWRGVETIAEYKTVYDHVLTKWLARHRDDTWYREFGSL